jgi:hypothetical protein
MNEYMCDKSENPPWEMFEKRNLQSTTVTQLQTKTEALMKIPKG